MFLKKEGFERLTMPFSDLNFEVKTENRIGDTRFLEVEISLMHLGENYNGSYFAKDVVEKELDSLKNTPILGYIEDEDYSDHRAEIQADEDGYKFVYKGSAYGVIPETNNARFVDRVDQFGTERTYLVVDGLMWTKWEEPISILENKGFKSQSMELHNEYAGEFKDDGLFHFTQFKFFGACLLGENVQPAMEGANVQVKFEQTVQSDIKERLEEYHNFVKKNEKLIEDKNKAEQDLINLERERSKFMLSIEQIKDALWEQLNPKDEDGYRSYGKWIVATFPDENKIIVNDETDDNANFKKIAYVVSEDGIVTLGEEEIIFAVFLTQSEKDEVERIRANTVSTEDFEKIQLELNDAKKSNVEVSKTLESTKEEFAKSNVEVIKVAEELAKVNLELSEIKPQLEEFTKEQVKQEKIEVINEFKLVSEEVKQVFIDKIEDYTKEEIKSELTDELIKAQEDIMVKMSKIQDTNENLDSPNTAFATRVYGDLFEKNKKEERPYADLVEKNKK